MVHRIRVTNSLHTNGTAFNAMGPDSLIVDAGAFLLSDTGRGVELQGDWTATINGIVGSFASQAGLFRNGGAASTFTIGKAGEVFGGFSGVHLSGDGLTFTNSGRVSGGTIGLSITTGTDVTVRNGGMIDGGSNPIIFTGNADAELRLINSGKIGHVGTSGSCLTVNDGTADITNYGSFFDDIDLGSGIDSFTNYLRINGVLKHGIVVGVIDLHGGDDLFKGGASAETVQDGDGSDSYSFGAGNDIYLAVRTGGSDGADIVRGNGGIDTYDASAATASISLNLDTLDWFTGAGPVFASSVTGGVGGNDTVTGFENAIGGSSDDVMFGSSANNVLTGGNGLDFLAGLGGRDVLSGGFGDDTFFYWRASDSLIATRDVIRDFESGDDEIDLSNVDANGGAAGLGAFTYIGTARFGADGDRGELRISFSNGDTNLTADLNGDGRGDFGIILRGYINLAVGDLVI